MSLKSLILDPPLSIAFKRIFLEFNIIFLHSFLVNNPAFLKGLTLHKNKISLAYMLPIPDTNF